MVGTRQVRGFSLPELIVAIGMVMVLVGLAIPALRGARQHADHTRNMSLLRSHFGAVTAYANDWSEVFPVAERKVIRSQLLWFRPMVAAGHLEDEEDSDPGWFERVNGSRFALSATVIHPPENFIPGSTIHGNDALTSPIKMGDVVFPSEKGVLFQWLHLIGEDIVPWTYNIDARPISPIVRGDGSAFGARAVDFKLEHEFFEYWVGHPVASTWGGCRSADRLK